VRETGGGYAYTFRATGSGLARITAVTEEGDEVVQEIKWSANGGGNRKGHTLLNGFLLPLQSVAEAPSRAVSARFEFMGAYRYEVQELQTFNEIVSNRTSDIVEYGDWIPYNFADIVDDFFAFSEVPVMRAENEEYVLPSEYLIRDSILSLPFDKCGDFLVEYEKKLDEITEGCEIEIDDELAQVLAYPIASELWLDVEPEKATYYEDMFVRSISTVMAMRRSQENPIIITNGWEN
jgi:hypothetical protein